MKIDKTLIYKSISYGIPEGTKVPEKPNLCDNYISGTCERMDDNGPNNECYCDAKMGTYADAIQALLSVAIRWEDQGDKRVDGIYPLLGVEGYKIFQDRLIVLRLIPQINSETGCSEGECHLSSLRGKRLPYCKDMCGMLVEGTGVSEPTHFEKHGIIPSEKLENWGVGVDEKKEPEIHYAVYGGVSEEEPTQDELILEIEKLLSSVDIRGREAVKRLYHIQKLKP